ncbi:MAG: hypothetical protein JXR70_12325 [Spirochaetales bacterium]|nr:hypothetical protein [Spirochaetales bacterium]
MSGAEIPFFLTRGFYVSARSLSLSCPETEAAGSTYQLEYNAWVNNKISFMVGHKG